MRKNSLVRKEDSSSDIHTKEHLSLRFTLLDWLCASTDIILNSESFTPQNDSSREESQLVLRVPSLFASLICNGVHPPDVNLVAKVIECLCSINIASCSEVSLSQSK